MPLNEATEAKYVFCTSGDSGALEVIASGTASSGKVLLSSVTPTLPTAQAGNYVKLIPAAAAGTYYCNPIVRIESEIESEDDSPALTVYIKRDTNVETQRESLRRVTDISVDKLYTVALSNAAKVVLAKFKK